jgi:hypothetical protein
MNKKVRFVYRGTLLIGFLGAGACLTAMDTQQKQPLIKQEIVDLTEDTEPENQINRLNTVPPVVQLQQQPVHQTKRRSVDDLSPVEIHAITGDIYALVDNQIRRNQEFDYGDIAQLCTTKYHLAFPQTLDGFVLNKLGLQPPNDMLKLGLGGLLKQQQKLRKLIFDYYTSFPRCTQLALCTHLVEKGYVFNKEQIPSLLVRVELDDLIALDDLQQKLGPPQTLQAPRDIVPRQQQGDKNKNAPIITQPTLPDVVKQNSISDKKLKKSPRRFLTQEERDALKQDLAICIYEKKEKINNADIRAIGKKYGLNGSNVSALLHRRKCPCVSVLQQFSPERRQKLLEKLGFKEDRLRDLTKTGPIVPEKNVVEQNSISDKEAEAKKPRCRYLTQKEKDAITLALAICIYEKKEKINNADIRAIGKKYGF